MLADHQRGHRENPFLVVFSIDGAGLMVLYRDHGRMRETACPCLHPSGHAFSDEDGQSYASPRLFRVQNLLTQHLILLLEFGRDIDIEVLTSGTCISGSEQRFFAFV